jgi:hypothetical protein
MLLHIRMPDLPFKIHAQIRGVLDRAIVEVKAVHVNVGLHGPPPMAAATRINAEAALMQSGFAPGSQKLLPGDVLLLFVK